MSETTTIAIEGGAIRTPAFEDHKRGKNWIAICKGPNAARMERDFLPMRGRIVDLGEPGEVVRGTVLEVGADYYNSRGAKRPYRDFYVVHSRSEVELVVEEFDTAAQAIKGSRAMLKTDAGGPGVITDAPVALSLSRRETAEILRLVEAAGSNPALAGTLRSVLGA